MTIVKGIVEAHGGKVGLTSEVGVGTTFFVELPLRPPVEAGHDPTSEGKLVLVADDDEDFLNLVTLRLEQDGHRVERASDGSEALRKAREANPDLCILDVMMPGLTGFEVLRELRAEERTEGMPVMLLTASLTDQEAFEGATDSAADDWMRKPFSTEEFRSRIAALLDRVRQSRADGITAPPGRRRSATGTGDDVANEPQ